MFQQHPVPQQISSYQFRLVGDMTLKQFFQLAAGAAIGLLIYATPLPSIFKWPLVIVFVVAGAAFAFLPLQERPLEEWLSAFFRAIYGPTIFRWKREKDVRYFAPTSGDSSTTTHHTTVVSTESSVINLESKETNFLSNLTTLFSSHSKHSPATESTVNNVSPALESQNNINQTAQAQILTTEVKPAVTVQTTNNIPPQQASAGTLFVSTPASPTFTTQKIGYTQPVIATQDIAVPMTSSAVEQTLHPQEITQTTQAQFSPEAAPPTPATIANIVVGQVITLEKKIVEGAILEITDFQGRPVRALKSNKLGHFMIVTPLPNGSYKITIEKEGLNFDPISFETHGSVMQPIAIQSKN